MKNRNYLKIRVTRHNGTEFNNPLTLKEVHLISKMARENKSLTIELGTCTQKEYEQIFG